MGYLDTRLQLNPFQNPTAGGSYANIYPVYEITTPQYPVPSPWNLASLGYVFNELVYACIGKRMTALSEPPLRVYDDSGDTPEEVEEHPMRALLRRPNERVSEALFWQITELSLLTAGFAPWEIEFNNAGEPINLWAMRPDWCSFYRGEGRPLRAVRYQPYGLPPVDVPIERVLLFQYFDPRYPLLKGLSPTAVALRTIGVDNSATDMIKLFFERGAVMAGVLKTDQNLNDQEATRIRERWREQHGGKANWWDIAVLGSGVELKPAQMNMRDMQFDQLDARNESRICATFHVPPILINAKVGLDRSTFSNYGEARQAFYEDPVQPEWRYLADEVQAQLLVPHYEGGNRDSRMTCRFDLSGVKALQEDRDKQWTRAVTAYNAGNVTRDESREEMGLKPIDNAPVFKQQNTPAALPGEGEILPQTGKPPVTVEDILGRPAEDDAEEDAKRLERKQFLDFAKRRAKEGKPDQVKSFKFKHLTPGEQAELMVSLKPAWRGYP